MEDGEGGEETPRMKYPIAGPHPGGCNPITVDSLFFSISSMPQDPQLPPGISVVSAAAWLLGILGMQCLVCSTHSATPI